MRSTLALLAAFAFALGAFAQTAVPPAKRLPPAGIALAAADRAELTAGAAALRKEIDALARETTLYSGHPDRVLPDLEIFHKAVDWALRYDEFFDVKQVEQARSLLREGMARAAALRANQTPWRSATGIVIRGFRSKLDGSIQPYAIVVPPDWTPATKSKGRRLDVVLAGRNEKRTELAFIVEHEKNPGEIVPENALVLHPYGRFCNATKFAGEVDVFEAIEAVRSAYGIDEDRILVRGFSMGGASTWHLAAHRPTEWCAASPGAGFAETPIYARAAEIGAEGRPWWEQKLWRWYDATDYAGNFFNCPTIAYSGELDPQKQAADIMETAMAHESLKLERLVGPQTGHKYHPETKTELARRLDALAAKGRDPLPKEIRFTTYTLRYPSAGWIYLGRLKQHWERAQVTAKIESPALIRIATRNVAQLSFDRLSDDLRTVVIDDQEINVTDQRIAFISLSQNNGQWSLGALPPSTLAKRFRLTGPIDDAFMESFVFVRPTGKPLHEKSAAWVEGELRHATKLWRDLFRGDAPVKDDVAINRDDVVNKNLILWGDPSSNIVLEQILGRLPITWDGQKLTFRGQTYDAAHHMPILIFPNPLNPTRYIVINSGIDFRDEAYGTNALQTPKLPDYAIVDLTTSPGPRWPGKIVDAGFFDEEWQLSP